MLLLTILIKFINWFWLLFLLTFDFLCFLLPVMCLWLTAFVYSFIYSFICLFIYIFLKFCISELPPPSVNVQSADVEKTEAVVSWSHPELYDMYAISSYSLQVRKLNTKKWTQFTTTRDVSHRLTNLDPDTVYFVRLKSENKYGKGNPSESAELRTKKGMFLFLLLCTGVYILAFSSMSVYSILYLVGSVIFVLPNCWSSRAIWENNSPVHEPLPRIVF